MSICADTSYFCMKYSKFQDFKLIAILQVGDLKIDFILIISLQAVAINLFVEKTR